MKTCTKCNKDFPATTEYFYHHIGYRDNLKSWCKECCYTYKIESQSDKKYRERNRERWLAKKAEYREKNREKVNAARRDYYQRNKEKIKADARDRKALIRKQAQGHKIDWQSIIERDNFWCYLCDSAIKEDYHFDHKIPLVLGGTHTEDNLFMTHPLCNLQKGAKI